MGDEVAFANKELFDRLIETGIVAPGDKVTRVVIDIQVSEIPKIYIERLASTKNLGVVTTLKGIQVEVG